MIAFGFCLSLLVCQSLKTLAILEKIVSICDGISDQKNYFYEMSVVTREMARIISPGGHIVMVNDNVQYIGEEIPVDFILSDFAVDAGLVIDKIYLPSQGKGNSSQQMSLHGRRNETRKCVHKWSKPVNT